MGWVVIHSGMYVIKQVRLTYRQGSVNSLVRSIGPSEANVNLRLASLPR